MHKLENKDKLPLRTDIPPAGTPHSEHIGPSPSFVEMLAIAILVTMFVTAIFY